MTKPWDGERGEEGWMGRRGGLDYCIYLFSKQCYIYLAKEYIFLLIMLLRIKLHCLNEILL